MSSPLKQPDRALIRALWIQPVEAYACVVTKRKNSPPRKGPGRPDGGQQVRVIGGQWRGRRIEFPASEALRPTPDRVRETLFNWLQTDVVGSRCLDLFAGSGALGIEALSRGAAEVVLVENDATAARRIETSLERFQTDSGRVVQSDAFRFLEGSVQPFDIVFLDPPYASRALASLCAKLDEAGWVRAGGLVYLEDAASAGPPELPPGWTLLRSKRAGDVGYHLARREPPAE